MTYDFVIVGSGIAGASVAYELARSGVRVLLLEREDHVGYHATGRSAALFSELYGNACIRALTSASHAFFDAPPEGLAEQPLLTTRGCLFVGAADQRKQLDAFSAAAGQAHRPVQRLGAKDLKQTIPILKDGVLVEGVYEGGAMDIDVHALHQGFLRLARRHGAELRLATGDVEARAAPGGWTLRAANENVQTAVLINAAGAWADLFAEACGVASVGLTPLRRTALLVDGPSMPFDHWPAVIDASEQWYFKPDAGQLLLSPADETPTAPSDVQPDEFDLAVCVDRVQQVADLDIRRIRRSWAGLRTFAPDRSPVVGFAPEAEGFFWLAGQGGYGIQTSPALGRAAAALALHENLPEDLVSLGITPDMLSPERFAHPTG
jgi:D-arginine dehydrogenase